ncbi:phosphotransferase family protein, partial [Promineifilum sp.]|uniref:phosphotransferase family protein n=1 Tax=Promineifilum sp. TaxID=2664178 RepID=UPI0035ADFCBD
MNPMPDDIIPVRPDERLDEARLADYLAGRLPGSEGALSVRQFGGGAANLTYLLDYGTHEYVLRRPPLGPVAASAHDMGREYRVLSVLWR